MWQRGFFDLCFAPPTDDGLSDTPFLFARIAFLEYELTLRGFKVARQQSVPVIYKGIKLDAVLRYDLLVDDCIVVELKAVTEMHPVFDAVIMAYMRLLQKPKGILINFCCQNIFHDGQKTFVNEIYRDLPDF